ncbi:MAG: TonB-dependent receptor [Acidobacteria bacterium]|nr:TonB-dependent receptor [Acidobacteriota bacterium]
MARLKQYLVLLAVVITLPAVALAQSADTATVIGTITDSQGGVLPGAAITAHNVDTGFARAVVSEANGFYRLSALPPGRYELTAELQGMEKVTRRGVTLTLNSQSVLDFTLQIAGVSEAIVVTADSPVVETTTAQVASTMTRDQIDALPLIGRSVFSLVRLTPGAQSSNGTSFTGSRGRSNQFLIDGVDNSEDISGYNRQEFAVDAIKEFQVLINNFKAEYGRASGGIINVVTRSGTNNLHGNGFYLFRNQDLMAKDPFATTKDPFQRIHYGGTAGGPIVRDRTHFFSAYEREDRDTISTQTYVLPPANAAFSPATLQYLKLGGIDPAIFGAGGQTRLVRPEFVDVHKFNSRVDHQINNNQTLTVRYTLERELDPSGTSDTIYDFNGATSFFRTQYGNVAHKWIMSPTRVNEFYMQIGQTKGDWKVSAPNLPNMTAGGSTSWSLGGPSNYPQARTDYVYQFVNALTWMKPGTSWGDHTMKVGADYKIFKSNSFFDSNFRGTYTFTTLSDFITGNPSRFTQNRGDSRLKRPNSQLGMYAQDDWRVNTALTLNVGVRYDWENARTEALRDVNPDGSPGPGIGEDKNNLSPRFGFIWAPGGSTRQAIHGGTGVYYDQIILNIIGNARFTPPKVRGIQIDRVSGRPVPFPDPTAGGTVAFPPPNVSIIDPELVTPRNWNSSIGYRREITTDIGVDATYVHNRGYDHVGIVNINAGTGASITGGGAIRPDPNFVNKSFYTNLGRIKYDGLLLEVRKRHSNRWQGGFSYTLSKTRDNLFNFVSSIFYPQFPQLNEGPGADDRRHRINAHVELDLPWDLQWATILDFATEAPLDITAARDLNGDGLTGEWVNQLVCRNIQCPGFNYSRNSVRELSVDEANRLRALFNLSPITKFDNNPKRKNVDMTVQKRIRIKGDNVVRVTVEAFNVFNWPVLNQPGQTITSSLFGQITGINDGFSARVRAIQFTLQYDF